MPLPRQLKEIEFGMGLATKGDPRTLPEQLLDIAVNVEFDDIGGLRCRFPFDTVRTALVGGGTLTNARRFAMLGEELVCFTQTALYSWIPALSAWEYRGDHPAIATDEETAFASPGDQQYADRAELNGHIVHCWEPAGGGVSFAVRDKATGATVQGPTTLFSLSVLASTQPRLVALNSCVLLFWVFSFLGTTNLQVAKITVAPYAITSVGTVITTIHQTITTYNYDVCRIPGQDRCYAAMVDTVTGPAGGYTINSVDSSLAGAQTAGLTFSAPSGLPIAIAVSPDALFCTVVNSASDRKYADVWNVTAAGVPLTAVQTQVRLDNHAGTQLGGTSHVTAAYRLTQDGGQYRCYVFWSASESNSVAATTVFGSAVTWIDKTGAIGTDAPFVYGLGVAARAFAHDSHVYLVGVFAGLSFAAGDPSGIYSELQNTYYLYRDDGLLIGKAVWGEAGGFQPQGWLPNVVADTANANAMVLMGGIRRIVPVSKTSGAKNYAERAPREITFTFDDNRARRCVQFGATLYVLGSILLQYDGAQLVELGTCTYPWYLTASQGAAGAIAAAGYSCRATDRWSNAKGEVDRSTTATVSNVTLAGTDKIAVNVTSLYITRKTGVALEVWRTQGNPAPGVPFFLVTSQDPSVVAGDNDYLTSNPASSQLVTFSDNLPDASIAILPANPENIGAAGAALPNIEPPPATIAYTDSQRIYLAGIPGYPNTVYYSKYRQNGLVAAFNDALTFDTPADGGAITAIGMLDGTLIVWCETATYAFAGVGNDDTGGGTNFQLSRTLSKNLGCVAQEALAFLNDADGWLVKTGKGWFTLPPSLNYGPETYIGAGVFRYDAEPVLATMVLTARHQVRVLTSNRMLVYDTLVKQWAESTIYDGLDMLLWDGAPAYLTASGVRAELASWAGYAGGDYTLTFFDVETMWLKFGGTQARAILDFVQLLGQLDSTCVIRKRLAKDYEATAPGVWNYHTDQTWTPSPGVIGSALQCRQSPRWTRCESAKARFTVTAPDGVSPLGGPCAHLTSIVMQYANEPNAYSALGAAQKQ